MYLHPCNRQNFHLNCKDNRHLETDQYWYFWFHKGENMEQKNVYFNMSGWLHSFCKGFSYKEQVWSRLDFLKQYIEEVEAKLSLHVPKLYCYNKGESVCHKLVYKGIGLDGLFRTISFYMHHNIVFKRLALWNILI